jgi:signal transduction histidine kinase
VALQHPQWTAEEQKGFLEDFVDEIKRLTHLAEDLLFLQKNQTPPQDFKKINFLAIVKDSIQRIDPLCKDKYIKIKSNIPKDKIEISGVEKELEKLCFNLLHNAVKFSPKKSSIKLNLSTKGNQVVLEIKDAGPGISKADQEQVFDRFFKADSSRSFDYQGAGLGLSIVRKIIRTHQGQIKVKSHPGMGTTFTVLLPKFKNTSS